MTHTIAEAGREALAAWLVEPPAPRPPRDELVLKTYGSTWDAERDVERGGLRYCR